MTGIGRVLLVGPLEGTRWRSITAYTSSLREMLLSAGLEVETASAPWFNPQSIVSGARRHWTRQPSIRAAEEGSFDVVHLTDHALGHHVRRFQEQSAVVVTCHDVMPFTTRGYYRSRREATVKRAFLRRPQQLMCEADRLIAVSEFTRGQIVARYGLTPEEIPVVSNVTRSAFRFRTVAEAGAVLAAAGITLPGAPRVLSIGHTQGYKNFPALLAAMAEPGLAHAALVRVGSKLSAPLLKRATELGVAHRIHEIGAISDDLLAHVYAACDALAQPSLAEGFGMPVIEAMACGLPVVASDGGALPEVAGEAAILVSLQGADFAARLAQGLILAFEQREKLAPAGLARAELFRPYAVLPALLAAYARAVAHAGEGRA